ncbi:ABC transporter substrate-binding protein [Streptacidiphilus jiangxiensis]|uniref:Multiple sugar transport system substrate-binding protein/raffinose/stachyose/melibiose transport system substrate-binding protein n=1 Tax=Streptacidiphilus jiangxiensis TaxID=235985 RepID=A0A1H7WDL4_STRJI|nr:extracellular solute-binding protein [Streptacidiphilus jiangxiensis]SEM19444.1 multiple sugar transport system substrate-binding protein/raffinose/stachyose/melibiose transport system substrate-binding protein [Streptacidiphilus jiangxiensis]
MRHTRLTAACIAAGLALLTGCSAASTGGSAAAGGTTLTYLTFETPSLTASFWDTSIANGEKKVPGLTIKKIVAPSTDRDAYAKQLQASGQFPDLLQSITPSTFATAGLLKPYDQNWVNANFMLPMGNAYKGKVYIPPTNSQIIPMVFYNKKMFAKAGITAVPKTWADFMAVNAKLKAAGMTPIELGGGDPFAASMPLVGILSADVLGKDPNWLQERYAGKVHFTDANVEAAVAKYRTMVKNGDFEDGALGVKYADSITNFTSGKTAMYMMGSWFLGSVPKANADDFGSFMTPTDDGSLVVPFAVGGSMAISAKTADPAKATAFAEAWSLDPANYKTLIEGDGAFPMLKGKTLADYNVNVTQVFKDSYSYVTDQNTKVSAFGWATNDDSMPSGLNDAFYAASQALFTSDDVNGQMAKLDAAWDAATK